MTAAAVVAWVALAIAAMCLASLFAIMFGLALAWRRLKPKVAPYVTMLAPRK